MTAKRFARTAAGVALLLACAKGCSQRKATYDAVVVTYGGAQGCPAVYATETVTDAATIRAIADGFDSPKERDCGPTGCSFWIQLSFLKDGKPRLTALLASDGCGVVRVTSGQCPAGGRSGYFVPGNGAMDGFVRRFLELEKAQRRNPPAGDAPTSTRSPT